MRVFLASQILSYTVSAEISTYVALGKLPDEAIDTAKFINKIDGLFDSFNSRSLWSPKPLPWVIKQTTERWSHLDVCLEMLRSISMVGSNSVPPCIAGWQQNIHALRALWKVLSQQYNFDFLYTSRLNQDCIENLFSLIRGWGGFRDNSDPVQFKAAFKQVLVQNFLVPPSTGNCEADLDSFILDFDDMASRQSNKESKLLTHLTNVHHRDSIGPMPSAFNINGNENEALCITYYLHCRLYR